MRDYLSAHAYGNADWPDLVERLDRLTPVDLKAWSRAWVSEAGRPSIVVDLQTNAGRITRLALRQTDPRGRGLLWPQRVQVLVASPANIHAFDVTLDATETEVPDAAGLPVPTWVLPVGQGTGYGDFTLDAATVTFLSSRLHSIRDPLTRGAALIAYWESMLDGRVSPEVALDTVIAALAGETDELNLQQMLDDLRALFWRFTTPDERPGVAPRVERVLRTGLDRARTTSEKAAWFSAFRAVATTPDALIWLEQVWRRQVKIAGLPLSEVDEADLAAELALRDVPAAPAILDEQQERFANPDRRARFVFIRPALSSTAATRDRFFDSLRDVRTRTREAWVIDAARYLHHPLRAGVSRRYIRPALELLREIQQTGDIFFPKRWADATLSGYQSIQTAADVRSFIGSLPPDYPARLRWVLLSSADPLYRAARLQQR
jgi:aminopeptidase N